MNLICKIKGCHVHLLDFIDLGTEYQFCTRCGWKNYTIDTYGGLTRTGPVKEFKL